MYETGDGVSQSYKDAFHYWCLAAKQDMMEAQYKVAEYLMGGHCGESDIPAAVAILKILQGKGYPPALFIMGQFLMHDIGTQDEGVALVKQAAKSGYMPAVEYITVNNL